MKLFNKTITGIFIGVFSLCLVSCEDYLDKTPDSDLTEEQVFGNYKNFQGYVDLFYGNKLIAYTGQILTSSLDVGDDVGCNKNFTMSYNIPYGIYSWVWSNYNQNVFNQHDETKAPDVRSGFWTGGWYNIRDANLGLKSLNLLKGATEEERNLIKGQLLFFRAWSHFEIARCWGGIPYVDTYLEPDANMKFSRLTYSQTLMRIVQDFDSAAVCLPVDWNDTEQGKAALNSLVGRVTKGAALAAKARALLYAASPLTTKMEKGTPEYDLELCKKTAEAAWEVIKLAQQGVYELVPWDQYSDNFANIKTGSNTVWTKELIWTKLKNGTGQGQVTNGIGRIHNSQRFGGNGVVTSATLNMVELYGTATGYPIKDAPASDYNPQNPWANRDPRLLKTILVDGVKWVEKQNVATSYIQLYSSGGTGATGAGLDMDPGTTAGSITGFLIRKYIPYGVNNIDKKWDQFRYQCPFIRLAEMYLTFAEAANEAYGPNVIPPFATMTAVEAVNTVRRRVKLPVGENITKPTELFTYGSTSLSDVLPQYTVDKETFRESIRNERSVELAYEGHRWFDLRRWYLAHLPEYKIRYKCVFDKNHTFFRKEKLFEGIFEEKHYWLPFRRNDVNQYSDFKQNPGWE
ncbi:MAG: RagB/SusD family nutrient uptake outer membrane protein [Bacteroidales bacterium]